MLLIAERSPPHRKLTSTKIANFSLCRSGFRSKRQSVSQKIVPWLPRRQYMGKLGTMLQVGRTFGVRDGMLRLEYELQRGSGLMSRKMRSVEGWGYWRLDRIVPGTNAEAMRTARQDGSCPFFFTDVRTLCPSIKNLIGPEGEKSVLAEAERILSGKLTFFGQLFIAGEFPPQWFRNAVTSQSISSLQSWTQMRFASPAYGDLKFILEPSRFLF